MLYPEEEIEKKLSKARKKGIEKVIGVPLDSETSLSLLQISEKYKEIIPTAGIHPRNAMSSGEEEIKTVCKLLENPNIKAVAEIGVDKHFLDKRTVGEQLAVFRSIIDKGTEQNLPVVLHCPRAEPLLFDEIKGRELKNVVFHWYTGPNEILRKILDTEGYYISVTPAVAYSGKLQKVVNLSGLDKIIVESDGPAQYRNIGEGKPSKIPMVIEKISEIKDVEAETVARQSSRNAEKIFKI